MPKRSHAEIADLIEDLNASDLTVGEFAATVGVSVATIYNWKRKASQTSSLSRPVRLVPRPLSESPTRSGLLLQLPGHLQCHLEPDFDPHTLLRWIATLNSFPSSSC